MVCDVIGTQLETR